MGVRLLRDTLNSTQHGEPSLCQDKPVPLSRALPAPARRDEMQTPTSESSALQSRPLPTPAPAWRWLSCQSRSLR